MTFAWRSTLLQPSATMQDAIRCLDETGMQIAMVVSANDVLVGTVTDGDIRRGLLRNIAMSAPVESIVHRDPMVVPPQWGRDMVLQLMQANKIHQLPIVDERRRVVGLHVWAELLVPSSRPNVMVVMAGGRGTRLMPHTMDCPKPMLPVGDKPMLEHILERARADGFRKFMFAVHYLGHMIEEYFGNGQRWDVSIEYLREEAPLGTAGALGLIRTRPDQSFIVTNGDVLTDIRYGELLDFHDRQGAAATMTVRVHEWQHPFGVVRISGVNIVGFEEKPVSRSHINAGIYVLDPDALACLEPNEHCHMPALFTRLQEKGARTIVYPMHEPWLDVGQPSDLARARGQAKPAG